MAALTLVNRSLPVTLLESGQHVPDGLLVRAMGRNVFRRRPTVGAHRDVGSGDGSGWFQSLVPGGLSNYWVGASPRFSPDDFVEGERLDERYRWPLGYADLVSYYERCERVLRMVGDPTRRAEPARASRVAADELPGEWRTIARHAAGLGHGLAPMPLADGPNWMVSRTGVGFNSFTSRGPPLTAPLQFRFAPWRSCAAPRLVRRTQRVD